MERVSRSSWASDLVHPLPLGAALGMAVNDHVLKGAGVLPGWVTGKLSDFAGLFFFPLLLAAIARGASVAVRGRDVVQRRALAAAAALATGAFFTAVKICPPANAWVAGWWGVMQLDATDLFALPMIPLSAAFMIRSEGAGGREQRPARRLVDLAAVLAVGLASAATSQAKPPVAAAGVDGGVPAPPAVAADGPVAAVAAGCASLAVSACERSAGGTFVVIETVGGGPGACDLDVLQASEITPDGAATPADRLPAHLLVEDHRASTFALAFLRPVPAGSEPDPLRVALEVRRALGDRPEQLDRIELTAPCSPR